MVQHEMPQLGEGEEIKHVQEGVTLFIDDRPAHGRGTLFVTTHNLLWHGNPGAGEIPNAKLSLHWRSILMHAVSRDPNSFPHPCIYCQVQGCQDLLGGTRMERDDDGEEEEDEDEDEKINEVRFVVEEDQILGVLFTVFSECQSLHPDDIEQDEGDFMFNVEEVEEGALGYGTNSNGNGITMPSPADVDELMRRGPDHNNPDRFADAD